MEIDEKGNISNKYKLAMAFNIWRVLDKNEYQNSLDYIDKNKWVLFTLVIASYKKLIVRNQKSSLEAVSEIAWATGYIIPKSFDFRLCGYNPSVCRNPYQQNYIVTPNILKHSVDIDIANDDGEKGSVLYELKQLPVSCFFDLKDTIKKYNKKWEDDIRTNLYQCMGLGYQYVLDFYSFINICAYYKIETAPLKSVWNSYMLPAVQKPLTDIAKDFPEYRSFWESWYNELYQYAYEMFSLAEESFQWDTNQMQSRKQMLVNSGFWADNPHGKSSLSVDRNNISIDAENFAEKWLGRTLNRSSDRQPEFHGFFTSKTRNTSQKSDTRSVSAPKKVDNISIDEIREIINVTSSSAVDELSEPELPEPELPAVAFPTVQPKRKIFPKLCFLNGGILASNILLFSFLEMGNPILTSLIVLADVAVFVFGNYKILSQKPPQYIQTTAQPTVPPETAQPEEPKENKRKNKYIETLNKNSENPIFSTEINTTKEQIEQMQSRLQKINDILSEHFKPTEMTYQRFAGIIETATTRFYANIKTMLKRINLFDTKDYLKISGGRSGLSESAKKERLKVYGEHINYVRKIVEANENIISKLDRLLLELTKLDDFSEESLNNNSAVNELNELIEQTKFYKQ